MSWRSEAQTRIHRRERYQLEQMGKALAEIFDTHYTGVRRQLPMQPAITEIYSNIPVHMTAGAVDNPDPNATSTFPVITSYTIHMPTDTDVRNNDTIIIKIPDSEGNIKDAFRGIAGSPTTWHSRKRISLAMNALGRDDIINDVTPLPPEEEKPVAPETVSELTIRFVDATGNEIRTSIIKSVPRYEEIDIEALEIHGFDFLHMNFDNEIIHDDKLTLTPKNEKYTIEFVYEKVTVPIYLRNFSTGAYTNNMGMRETGAHWWGRLNLHYLGQTGDLIHIAIRIPPMTEVGAVVHPTNFATIPMTQIGRRVRLYPDGDVMEIRRAERVGNEWRFDLRAVTPTAAELGAYVTFWYDWFN